MASYTPKLLVTPAYVSSSAGILYQPGGGITGIIRTMVASTTSTGKTISLDIGTTTADGAATQIVALYALTASLPFILNGWYVVTNANYLTGITTTASTVAFSAFGYEFS